MRRRPRQIVIRHPSRQDSGRDFGLQQRRVELLRTRWHRRALSDCVPDLLSVPSLELGALIANLGDPVDGPSSALGELDVAGAQLLRKGSGRSAGSQSAVSCVAQPAGAGKRSTTALVLFCSHVLGHLRAEGLSLNVGRTPDRETKYPGSTLALPQTGLETTEPPR